MTLRRRGFFRGSIGLVSYSSRYDLTLAQHGRFQQRELIPSVGSPYSPLTTLRTMRREVRLYCSRRPVGIANIRRSPCSRWSRGKERFAEMSISQKG